MRGWRLANVTSVQIWTFLSILVWAFAKLPLYGGFAKPLEALIGSKIHPLHRGFMKHSPISREKRLK